MKQAAAWAVALLFAFRLWGFSEAALTVDGNFDDWAAVLADADNFTTDGAKDAGDLDDPGQTTADLRVFGLSWDSTNLYFYFQRGSQSNAGISYVTYLDADHNGILQSTEFVTFHNFNNSGFLGFSLYRYVPFNPSGDVLTGDGQKMPGSLGALLSSSGQGAQDATMVKVECSVPWSQLSGLGVPAKAPMFIHPSLSLGTNLPSQIQDNGQNINSQTVALSLVPNGQMTTPPGQVLSFSHEVTNLGNGADTVEFSAVSLLGWDITFWNADGTVLLGDSNGNGKPDSSVLAAQALFPFTVRIAVPSSAPTQSNDTVTVTAASSVNSQIKAQVVDLVHSGLATFAADQQKTGMPGSSVPYTLERINNFQSQPVMFSIVTQSTQGWICTVFPDDDCDGSADGPAVSQIDAPAGGTTCLITHVQIPPEAPLGSSDTATTALSFGVPVQTLSVISTTTVTPAITFTPDYTAAQGPGESIFYNHVVGNSQDASDIINLSYASSLGWAVTFFASDRITPLVDTNGDSIVDTGGLPANGGSRNVSVRVTVPFSAMYNQTDTTLLSATSATQPLRIASATDTTTVKMLVYFSDPAYSQPTKYFAFSPCSPVYMKAFGLSNGTYRFMIYDALGTLKTLIPIEQSPDQSGQIAEVYQLGPGDPLGVWTGKVQKKTGGSWSDVANYLEYFYVAKNASLSVQTGKSVYNQIGANVSVSAQFTNGSNANIVSHAVRYVIFYDSDGDDQPDPGETYMTGAGSGAAYTAGASTHVTIPLDVPANSDLMDIWGMTVSDFTQTGTWKLQTTWVDNCGNTMASSVIAFQVVSDSSAPTSWISIPTNGVILYLSASPIDISGGASDVGSSVAGVEVSTDNGATWADASGTTSWTYLWAVFMRGAYLLQSRATDSVGNVEWLPYAAVSVTVVDDTPPSMPSVTDDGLYTASSTTLHAVWTSQDLNSGISAYRYCVGTSIGVCDVTAWLDVGLTTDLAHSGLTLVHSITYYFNVISTNLDGYDSSPGVSDGITCDRQGPTSAITAPIANQTLSGAVYTIQGTASDLHSGVALVEVSADGGASWISATGTTSWNYLWILPPDGDYMLYARARDAAGNIGPVSAAIPVKVDNPPSPPSNLSATPDGNCVITLKWSPSPSSDLDHYTIYHNNGGGPVDYSTPIAEVGSGSKTWTSSRGVYGWCGQDVALDSEGGGAEKSVAIYTIINTNKEDFTISGATVGWTADVPQRFLARVEIGGVTVFSRPSGTTDNNGGVFTFSPSTTLAPGQTADIRFHFEYVAGGYPEMTGNTVYVTLAGGPSPRITALLLTPGLYPDPCRTDPLQSLIVGAEYTFGIRAFDGGGAHDGNTAVTVGSPACAPSLAAVVLSPKVGEKVMGREVTVYAEIAFGNLWNVQRVLFQYRVSPAGGWTDMPGTLEHPNPDTMWPYFTYWDASVLSLDDYDLRAVARHTLGYDDPSPLFVTTTLVDASQNLHEDAALGSHYAVEDVRVISTGNRVVVGDDLHDNVTQVWIPQNALTSDTTCTVAISADPGTVPFSWGSGLEFRALSLASGQINFTEGSLARIEIPYNDADGDGFVDGTTTPEWNLALCFWDGLTWSRSGVVSSQVDLLANVVRGDSSHLSLFSPLAEPPAFDFIPPGEATLLKLSRSGRDILFTWNPVSLDINGGPEVIHHYNVYRGTVPCFTPDTINHTNLIGAGTTPSYFQAGGIDDQPWYFFRVTAVDQGYNEGAYQP